jgi:hypothetical protein
MAADPKDFWAAFGDDSDFVEVTCDDSGSLAYDVLSSYGIPCDGNIGGGLSNLDIKRMDAIQVIKLSLLEASSDDGYIYEPIMNSEGQVEFVAVGTFTGLSGGDVYYELQTGTYIEACGGVMITGGRPLAYRRAVGWHPIWQNGPKEIYDTGQMITSCVKQDFSQQATIVFTDPHLDSRYEDGIDNLYEITSANPYDSIIGYAKYIWWPSASTDTDTVITRQDTAKILLQMPDASMGTFSRRPQYSDTLIDDPSCLEESDSTPTDPTVGVEVEIPEDFRYESVRGTTVDKFQNILDVYVVGLDIDHIQGRPVSDTEAVNENPESTSANVEVTINTTYKKFTKLQKGVHYVVAYTDLESGFKQPYIVFVNNLRTTDPAAIYGDQETSFSIDPECEYANEVDSDTGLGYILPTSETRGILVDEIHVAVLLETPSIEVYNPDGENQKAAEIARDLEYLVAPLIVVEEPSPVAFNGQLIDLTQGIRDHDPTTAQDFSDTDLEQALDQMSGNGMSLTLTFLDEDQCERLSSALYDYLNSGDGTEATYVCAPGTDVRLGGTAPNGGIVNSISYSYQDSNSYTISVSAGPTILGNFSQVDGGPSPKAMEEVSAKGTIIEDMGNHIYYKVRIDGIGERVAVNMVPTVLRVGDKVQCSVHNNPVEI